MLILAVSIWHDFRFKSRKRYYFNIKELIIIYTKTSIYILGLQRMRLLYYLKNAGFTLHQSLCHCLYR